MSDNFNCDRDSFLEFENLAQIVHKDLYIFLYSMCKDNELANDALQNALIKGYKNFHTLKNTLDFKSWMFTIGKRELYTIIRKNKKHYVESIEIKVKNEVVNEIRRNPEEEFLMKEKKKWSWRL